MYVRSSDRKTDYTHRSDGVLGWLMGVFLYVRKFHLFNGNLNNVYSNRNPIFPLLIICTHISKFIQK